MTHALVVDDEPQIQRFLRPTLQAEGYAVEAAATGAEALAIAARRPPDLVLLDLGLPDMQGHDVLKALRAKGPVPVVILSARHAEGGMADRVVQACENLRSTGQSLAK